MVARTALEVVFVGLIIAIIVGGVLLSRWLARRRAKPRVEYPLAPPDADLAAFDQRLRDELAAHERLEAERRRVRQ